MLFELKEGINERCLVFNLLVVGKEEGSNSDNVKEPRVDFDGKVIPRGSSTPYFVGLHHHGEDIMSAG